MGKLRKVKCKKCGREMYYNRKMHETNICNSCMLHEMKLDEIK